MLEIILLGAMTLTLGTIIFMVGGGVASQPLPEIINFAIDKSPYLLAKIARILTSFAVSIIFFILGALVVAIIGAKNFVLYYPHPPQGIFNTVYSLERLSARQAPSL